MVPMAPRQMWLLASPRWGGVGWGGWGGAGLSPSVSLISTGSQDSSSFVYEGNDLSPRPQ